MKTILGLDLGTNSIGWALVNQDFEKKQGEILGMGSRIIPMGAELSKFEQGQAQTKNANRRISRGARKLNKRYKQRRNKLIYVLTQMGMLPSQIKLDKEFDNPNKIDKINILPIDKKVKQLTAFELLQLRVKALYEPIGLEDLGRLFYLYNQLRGYSGGNSEPEKEQLEESDENEKKSKKENLTTLCKVLTISEPEELLYKGKTLKKRKVEIEIEDDRLEDNSIFADTFLETLKVNDTIELQISIFYPKKGEPSYQLKLPNKTSWRKKMENIEKELKDKTKELGREYYISEHLLNILKENKWAKIRNNVILRFRFENEFEAIWNTQYEKNFEFRKLVDDKELLLKLVNFIFPERDSTKPLTENSKLSKKVQYRNEALENKEGLKHLIKKQIIYYQRELKDQSHLISFCRFEPEEKVVSKSHPVFQEYRIWEQINKLNINTKVEIGRTKKGEPKFQYVDRPIPFELKEWIYDELLTKKEIGFAAIFKKLIKKYNFQQGSEFLNGIDTKGKIKTNETIYLLKKNLEEYWEKLNLDDINKLVELWEILYNGKGNEYDIYSDRTSKVITFLKENNIEHPQLEEFAVQISKIKFARNYANMSIKAIEKILPLTKAGKYFTTDFSNEIHNRIVKLVNENLTDPFEKSVQEYLDKNIELLVHGGIMNAYATILVYNKHTETSYSQKELITDFNKIKRLKQGELRNPLAEQMINETLIIVKDIWKQFGFKPDEIRLELARELKNSAERRSKMHKANIANQKENERVRERLQELKEEITLHNIEKYKLWASQENLSDEFIKKYKDPSKSEIEKMRLWEDQGHISPYTGKVIPLSDLFDKGKYDIDHIIPKSRYFDDSLTNKVICETAVNQNKGNRTAMEYIEVGSTSYELRKKDKYIEEVNKMFSGSKRKNLLATKVPEDPILRQIKDTQYISVRTKEVLYKIVGNENVKTTTGGVTDYLRNQWGLTDKFKTILIDRYEALLDNEKYLDSEYEVYKKKLEDNQKEYKKNGLEFNEVILYKASYIKILKTTSIFTKNNKLILKNWSKRIDHRHHAIDALIVACTSQSNIQQLNNLNKALQDWLEKNQKELLPNFEGTPTELLDELMSLDEQKREAINKQLEKFNKIEMPWKGFDFDAEKAINEIIISQKPKDKLIIQKDTNGNLQLKIRGQLHEGTNYGKAGSREYKKVNSEVYRVELRKFAEDKFDAENAIEKITNEYLKTLIKNHFIEYKKDKKEAFSVEGINHLNNKISIVKSSKGYSHPPINKVRIYYKTQNETFSIGKLGSKKSNNKYFNEILNRVIDNEIKELLIAHLDVEESLQAAFSKEGINRMNKNLEAILNEKNNKKNFKPIKSIKLLPLESKNSNEEENNDTLQRLERSKAYNNSLYVKTGDNYLFAVMEKNVIDKKTKEQKTKRVFDIITFFEATKKLKEAFDKTTDKENFNKDLVFKNYFEKENRIYPVLVFFSPFYVYL